MGKSKMENGKPKRTYAPDASTNPVVAYDLDGVLAEAPPASKKKWGKMKGPERVSRKVELLIHYSKAQPLLKPKEQSFYVITARKNEPEVVEITKAWLKKHYDGRYKDVFFLKGTRTIDRVIEFKAKVIKYHGIKRYTEDNSNVINGLKKLCQGVDFIVWPDN